MEEITKRILLVEDDPNFGTVLKEYLTINNYEVVLAKNGMEGFEKFKIRFSPLYIGCNDALQRWFYISSRN